MTQLLTCPRCGGSGGEPGSKFGDCGWHPCYYCGNLGTIPLETVNAELRAAACEPERPAPQPVLWYDDASYARWQGDCYADQYD